MAFDGKEGEQITLAEAAAMTAAYRSANPGAVKAHYIGKELLRSILNQTGCVGARFYQAIDEDGNRQLVVVGVDSSEKDMTSGIIADRMKPCPLFCDTTSQLNG